MPSSRPVEAVERRSLSDAVFEQLRDRIVSGDIEPGAKLPPERELCERLGVNRNALREALKRLEQARLVRMRHGDATRALDFRRHAGPELLTSLLVDERGRVDASIARGVIEVRVAMGRDVARLAAARRRPEHVTRLEEIGTRIADARRVEDRGALLELGIQLWDLLVLAADNLAYRLVFNSVMQSAARMGATLTMAALAAELDDRAGQRAVVRAVVRGEPDAAERAARAHLERGAEGLTGWLATLERSSGGGEVR